MWNRTPTCTECGALVRRRYQGANKPEQVFNPDGTLHSSTCPAQLTKAKFRTASADDSEPSTATTASSSDEEKGIKTSDPLVIKKYPNRRLYDTAQGEYITLEDVRRIVAAGKDFVVIDKKTQNDVTWNVLLQVLNEMAANGTPVPLTCEHLRLLIQGKALPAAADAKDAPQFDPTVESPGH